MEHRQISWKYDVSPHREPAQCLKDAEADASVGSARRVRGRMYLEMGGRR